MTNLSNIKNIIYSFKQGRDYVINSENDGRTKKLIYTILTDELKREISPFSHFVNSDSIQGIKVEEGNRRDGYFSYELGCDGEADKFTIITGLEANQKEVEALRRPREIEQRMREIEQRQKKIAQQMQEVRESGGPEVINTTSYTERQRGSGRVIYSSSSSNHQPNPNSPQIEEIGDENEYKQEQCPLEFRPTSLEKK